MLKKILLPSFIFLASFSFSQTIPSNMRVDWSRAGLQNATKIFNDTANVMNFGAVADGITNDYPAFVSAYNSLNGNAGTIYFPEGTYLLRSPLNLSDSVIIAGDCSDTTKLIFNLSGSPVECINVISNQANSFMPIIAGLTKDTDVIIVSNASSFSVGDLAEIREQNGTWDTNPASWAAYSVGQIVRVTNITANELTITEPLHLSLDSSLSPEIRKITPVKNVGMQDLYITRADSVAPSSGYNIFFKYAYNCWVSGVESNVSSGAHVWCMSSSHISITGNYFHHAYAYDGTSSHGYGTVVAEHTSDCLIENNIYKHLRHAMVAKQGANGNVFGYNFSTDEYRTEFPNNAGGDISLHGHFPFANLFEGNISENLHIDQAWGPSGPFNTFYRNRLSLFGIIMTSGTVQSDSQNFVGNEVTNMTFPYGNYSLAGSGHFQYGNNIKGVITPAGTSPLNDTSYYRNSFSDFWNSYPSPPSVGIPNTLGSGSNPAMYRYLQGGKMPVCSSDTLVITGTTKIDSDKNIFVYPNPFSNVFRIKFQSTVTDVEISLTDLSGREIYNEKFFGKISGEEKEIRVPENIGDGIYFLNISSKEKSEKLLLMRMK